MIPSGPEVQANAELNESTDAFPQSAAGGET